MTINNKFDFGEVVYLKTDKDQLPRIITRFSIKPQEILYCLCQCATETWHLDFEISKDRDVMLATSN